MQESKRGVVEFGYARSWSQALVDVIVQGFARSSKVGEICNSRGVEKARSEMERCREGGMRNTCRELGEGRAVKDALVLASWRLRGSK